MALEVEDGTGKANADSYLAAADCTTYWTAHGAPTAWSSASSDAKDAALRLGTQYIDLKYGGRFVGYRGSDTQALAWPRNAAYDTDGYAIDEDAIPTLLKQATAEAALRQLTESAGLIPDSTTSRSIVKEDRSVGPLSESITYAGSKPTLPYFPIIDLLLRPICVGFGAIERS